MNVVKRLQELFTPSSRPVLIRVVLASVVAVGVSVSLFSFAAGAPDPQAYRYVYAGQTGANATEIAPGQTKTEYLYLKNTGSATWVNSGSLQLRLGTTHPFDRVSPWASSSWLSPGRPGSFSGKLVGTQVTASTQIAPGEIAAFPIEFRGLLAGGASKEYFRPLIEGQFWLIDNYGMYLRLSTPTPNYHSAYAGQSAYPTIEKAKGGVGSLYFDFKNTGTTAWTKQNLIRLAVTHPRDRVSPFHLKGAVGSFSPWLAGNRPGTFAGKVSGATLDAAATTIAPGEIGRFIVPLDARTVVLGDYPEYFSLVADGVTWMEDYGTFQSVRVIQGTPPSPSPTVSASPKASPTPSPTPTPSPSLLPTPTPTPIPTPTPALPRAEDPTPTPTPTPSPVPTPSGLAVFVDKDSVGGACSDVNSLGLSRTLASVTVTAPLCTIGAAYNLAPDKATIYLRKGKYNQLRVVNRSRLDYVFFKPYPGESVTIDIHPTAPAPNNRALSIDNSSYIDISGFKVVGGSYIVDRSHHINIRNNDFTNQGNSFYGVHHIVIEGNYFHDYYNSAVVTGIGSESEYVEVRNNTYARIWHDAIFLVHGFRYVTVEGNSITEVERPTLAELDALGITDPALRTKYTSLHSDAIQLATLTDYPDGAPGVVIRGNYIFASAQGILVKDGFTPGIVIENNVIANMSVWPMQLGDAPGARVINNTFVGSVSIHNSYDSEVITGPDGKPKTVITCRYYDDSGLVRVPQEEGGQVRMRNVVMVNNIISKISFGTCVTAPFAFSGYNLIASYFKYPLQPTDTFGSATFINAAGGNFQLQGSSLGIDAGTSNYQAPTADRVGQLRLDAPGRANTGAGAIKYYDIGAHEYTGTATSSLLSVLDGYL